MDALQQLIEKDRIARLKAAYFRLYDAQDWDAWLALFTEDATLRAAQEVVWSRKPKAPALALIGREAIGEYVRRMGPSRRTVHQGHTPEIDLLPDGTARGIWAMEDIIEYSHKRLHGHGHYHETYRIVGGSWKFASVELRRLRLTTRDYPESDLLDR